MVSDEVKFIKENKKSLIEKSSNSTYGIIFGHGKNIMYDACYARLWKRIMEQEDGGKVKSNMQYIIRYKVSNEIFDYKVLLKELNKIFGKYFKITTHLSGRKAAKIINIKELKEFPNISMKYAGYFMIFVLLRSIDGEYFPQWERIYQGDKMTEWFDIIYNYYKVIGAWGHGINDSLQHLGATAKNKKTAGNETLFVNAVENYLNILETAFGSNFDYKVIKKWTKIPKESYHSGRGQTATFQYIEKVIKQGGRK